MSTRVKAWLNSLRRSSSFPFDDNIKDNHDNKQKICMFDTISRDVIQYILSFLHHRELHSIRNIGKDWNNLCDVTQKTLELNKNTPINFIKYWIIKLINIRIINLSQNPNINDQFLIYLTKEYLAQKLREKRKYSFDHDDLQLNIHIDISFCFGINCVEVPQLNINTRGVINGYNNYLKNLMNKYDPFGVTFNIFGNYRIINPSISLKPKHVVLLQLYALKYNEIRHCFKFASPSNRQFTGPYQRFSRMITNGYPIMISWNNANIIELPKNNYSDYDYDNDDEITKLHFIVTLQKHNNTEKFKWTLSKQKLSPYASMWMTDSVSSFHYNIV